MDTDTRTRTRARGRGTLSTPFTTTRGGSDIFSPVRPGSPSRLSFTPKPEPFTPRGGATVARPSFLEQSTIMENAPSIVESNLRNLIREKEKELHNISAYKSMSYQSGAPTTETHNMQSLKLDHEYNLKLLNQRTRELEESENRVRELESSLETAQHEVTGTKAEFERIQQKFMEAQHVTGDKQSIIDRLELQQHETYKKSQEELDKLRWQYEEQKQNHKEGLEKLKRDLENEIRAKSQENKAQSSELAKLRSTYQSSVEEAKGAFALAEEKMKAQLAQELRKVSELSTENKALRDWQRDARQTMESYKRQNMEMQSRLKAGTHATEEVQQESYQRIQQITQTNTVLQAEKADLVAEYQAKVGELLGQLQVMEKEITSQRLEYERQSQMMMGQITAVSDKEQDLSSELEEEQRKNASLSEQLARTSKLLDDTKRTLKQTQSEAVANERRRQADALALKDMQAQNDLYTRELQLKGSQLEEIQVDYTTTGGEASALREKCERYEKEIQQKDFRYTTLEKEIHTIQEKHKTELVHLTEKYDRAVEKMASQKNKFRDYSDAKEAELISVRHECRTQVEHAAGHSDIMSNKNSELKKRIREMEEQVDEMNDTIQSLSENQRGSVAAALIAGDDSTGINGSLGLSALALNASQNASGGGELVGMVKNQFEALQVQLDTLKKKQQRSREKKAKKKAKEKEKEMYRREKDKAVALAKRQQKEKQLERVYHSVVAKRVPQPAPGYGYGGGVQMQDPMASMSMYAAPAYPPQPGPPGAYMPGPSYNNFMPRA